MSAIILNGKELAAQMETAQAQRVRLSLAAPILWASLPR